jgi:hypothetical protein
MAPLVQPAPFQGLSVRLLEAGEAQPGIPLAQFRQLLYCQELIPGRMGHLLHLFAILPPG